MNRPFLILSACAAALFTQCAPFPVPGDWPVKVKPSAKKSPDVAAALISHTPVSELSRQDRALLAFLADDTRVQQAVGRKNAHGGTDWRIEEIFLVQPGKKVSVMCEDGYDQEPLYFLYHEDNAVWYRVEDFENPKAASHPAVIVVK